MSEFNGNLDALIQEKIDADTDFQSSLEALSDEEKAEAVKTKRSELVDSEFTSLREKAEKLTKAEELANNYKIRAEKAEGKVKETPPAGEPTPSKSTLSTTDLYALMNAKVAEEDIGEVEDYAKLKKISITEALKSSVVKTLLEEKEEERSVAAATNVRNARPGSGKVSDDALLSNANSGKLPENDDEIARVVAAHAKSKR